MKKIHVQAANGKILLTCKVALGLGLDHYCYMSSCHCNQTKTRPMLTTLSEACRFRTGDYSSVHEIPEILKALFSRGFLDKLNPKNSLSAMCSQHFAEYGPLRRRSLEGRRASADQACVQMSQQLGDFH